MTPRRLRQGLNLAAVLALVMPALATADFRSQIGNTSVGTDVPTKARKIDPLVSTVVVPPDLRQISPFSYNCTVETLIASPGDPGNTPVKKVKVGWESHAYLFDRRDGSVQTLDVGKGTVKTGPSGTAELSLDVPPHVTSAIFSDGFESGDVAALLVTVAKLSGGRKMDFAGFLCSIFEGGR